jgi:putative heme-binding domain-containing protein
VILTGLKMPTTAGDPALRLLEFWTGQRRNADAKDPALQLASWQAWYAEQFPDASPAELPQESQHNKWSYDELLAYLDSPDGKAGSAHRGTQIFTAAQCINCHRFNGAGQTIGPDLTAVSQRFQRREVLESIVYPSHVVSDQYASHSVTANGRTFVGIIAREPDGGLTVVQADGGKVRLAADDIEDIEPSKLSTMPEGLLNTLTLEQVADLFALLMEGGTTNPNVAGRPAAQR